MTELKKQANRMMFNQAEEEFVDGEDTIGLGVIGKDGSGRLRALALQQRQKLSAKAQKKVRAGAGALVCLRVCVGVGGGGRAPRVGCGQGAHTGLRHRRCRYCCRCCSLR